MIEEEVRFNVPLITKEELRYIDYHYNSLVNKYLSEYKSQRDHLLTQRLIYNLERENKKLKKLFLNKNRAAIRSFRLEAEGYINEWRDRITWSMSKKKDSVRPNG